MAYLAKGTELMKLRNLSFKEFADKVKAEKKKIVVYGAGMIGQIVVPDIIQRFLLEENLYCFIDADTSKWSEKIKISGYSYEIKGIQDLIEYCRKQHNIVMLVSNSQFYSVIANLDSIQELDNIEAYLVPVMQITEIKNMRSEPPAKFSEKALIPKVIHYCWFSGKKMPDTFKRCIESWKKYCPDYEIIRWDESNYDINKNLYMKQAYENEKWGFVPDFARLDILYHYGGIYLDTDVELIRNLDDLLYQEAFCGVEKWGNINLGGCSGAIPNHPMIKKILEERKELQFVKDDGNLNLETCGVYETRPFVRAGMHVNNRTQQINDMMVYSSDYFHPYDYMSGQILMTENTFSIHHFNGGWLDDKGRKQRQKTLEQYEQILKRMETVKYGRKKCE